MMLGVRFLGVKEEIGKPFSFLGLEIKKSERLG